MANVFVAMSGGVDSAVAAHLMIEEGHTVTGVTMVLSKDDSGKCCSFDDIMDARMVCHSLGIPHFVVNYSDTFSRDIVGNFTRGLQNGITGNPCVECNKNIKFGKLLSWAMLNGADYLVTGHYAQIVNSGDTLAVKAGVDRNKDQSYFLYQLNQAQLKRVMFPLGGFTKPEVREIAEKAGLHIQSKGDSQGVCFVGAGYRDFVKKSIPLTVGNIEDVNGNIVGIHPGAALFTIGQRKGGLRYNRGTVTPENYVVINTDTSRNAVIVSEEKDLFIDEITMPLIHCGKNLLVGNEYSLVTRYHGTPVRAIFQKITDGNMGSFILVDRTHKVAKGQSIVVYTDTTVLDGGILN